MGVLKGIFRPDVHFHCDIDFDPFLYMEDNGKVYGVSTSHSVCSLMPTLLPLPRLHNHVV